MFYLFILESIGTSELIMIGLVALIVFGPRKLPQMMRTFGKTIAEFRRSTEDFKKTWQKEVDFVSDDFKTSDDTELLLGNLPKTENSVGRSSNLKNNKIPAPEIREVNQNEFTGSVAKIETPYNTEKNSEGSKSEKRNWL